MVGRCPGSPPTAADYDVGVDLTENLDIAVGEKQCPPFWYDIPPFLARCELVCPDWLKNTAGGRLFQLVVIVARRKDYVPHRNDQRPPDPLKRDQRTYIHT